MALGPASTPVELLRYRDAKYAALLQNDVVVPFRYPIDTAAGGVLILSILFVPLVRGRKFQIFRYASFALICLLSLCTLRQCRSQSTANGYGIGLICAWGTVWSATLLVFNDPRTAFQRLETQRARNTPKDSATQDGSVGQQPVPKESSKEGSSTIDEQGGQQCQEPDKFALFWQPYPPHFLHRLDWAMDLVTSFRGPGWNWRIRSLPRTAKTDSGGLPSSTTSLPTLVNRSICTYFVLYLIIDACETLFRMDPYFWGIASITSVPPDNFPAFIRASPFCTKSYRLFATMSTTAIALQYVMVLNPIFFGGIIAHYFPDLSRAPLHEPFLYPPQWGPATAILDQGLAGFWGKWWHQMFRHGISEPGRWLVVDLLHLNPRSNAARMIQVMTAFSLSGAMHACASYTQLADTKPLHPFLFFFLQGVGVLAQAAISRMTWIKRFPRWLRRLGNVTVVLIWAYFTGPLLADDFARGGIWLFEALPVSIWRGLLGKGWLCWHGKWFIWWGKGHWWERGIALA